MPSYTFIQNLAKQSTSIPTDSILSSTFYRGEDIKAILFTFAAGQELSEHTASKPAVLHFLQGEADLKLGSDQVTAQPGTWVRMPPRLPHSIFAKTDVLMLLYLIETDGDE